MKYEKLKQKWIAEEQNAFYGWDFSHIAGRYEEGKLPWDYKEIVLKHLANTDTLLDMGTGGGEFLLSLNHPYSLTSITEAYEPNVQLCKNTLEPLGITVAQVYDDTLPFEDSSFDIVINRHESFDAGEVHRILKNNSFFITQQVGGMNNADISKRLSDDYNPPYIHHNLANNISQMKKAGFEIEYADECFITTKFFDVGAFVYFAKIIEWEFPEFSVEKHFDKLCEFQREIEQKGYITSTEHRFIIAAKKAD
ncbi:MAG: methyltransferase domain-containing protein [Eubacteriales bacterium]